MVHKLSIIRKYLSSSHHSKSTSHIFSNAPGHKCENGNIRLLQVRQKQTAFIKIHEQKCDLNHTSNLWSSCAKSHSFQNNSLNHTHSILIQDWLHFLLNKISSCLMKLIRQSSTQESITLMNYNFNHCFIPTMQPYHHTWIVGLQTKQHHHPPGQCTAITWS